jgi:hypothetical protein
MVLEEVEGFFSPHFHDCKNSPSPAVVQFIAPLDAGSRVLG